MTKCKSGCPLTDAEHKIFEDHDKRTKDGKNVWFSYEPGKIMIPFITKYNVKVKKDKLGNIHIKISERKK